MPSSIKDQVRLTFRRLLLATCAFSCAFAPTARAENPIIQTSFTADPAPLVHNGVVYLYTSHDEDDAPGWFKMRDWRLYTSSDLSNWTDKGVVASLATFPWANQHNDAWAPQVVARNGKFYLYVPITVPGRFFPGIANSGSSARCTFGRFRNGTSDDTSRARSL